MKYLLLLFLSLTLINISKGQNNNDSLTTIINAVERKAEFPGGREAWVKYIMKSVRETEGLKPSEPINEKSFKLTVYIQFIVDKNGSLSNVKILPRKTDKKFKKQLTDALLNSPKWMPAISKGKYVAAYIKQPLTFVVDE